MTQTAQIKQLRDLRQMKVDRLEAEIGLARKRVEAAKDTFISRTLEYEKVLGANASDFDAVIADSSGIADAQTRMIAVSRTMQRQRAAEERAKTMRDEAEAEIDTADKRLEKLMEELLLAKGQLRAADTLYERAARSDSLIRDERADELAQEQFSADNMVGRAM